MEPVDFFVQHKTILIIGHVLSVVVGMGSALVADMLSIRFGMNKKLSTFEVSTVRFLSHVVTFALLGIVAFGLMLFFSDPEKYLSSSKFLVKMTVIGVLVINGFLLHRFVFSNIGKRGIMTLPNYKPLRRLGFVLGAVSVVSWISALILGLLSSIPFSYEIGLSIYVSIVLFASIFALIIEKLLLAR